MRSPGHRPHRLLAGIGLLWLCAGAMANERPVELQGQALIGALRSGGYSLYMRHAATDWSVQDRVTGEGDWTSCDAQRMRPLSATGRATARRVGEAMRALEIPVARVVASPYCRTRETAGLLGMGEVEVSDAVINLRVARYFGGRAAVIATARQLLSTSPVAGGNTLVVAHGNVAREATPVYPDEAETVVFEADGRGGFRLVGRLKPSDWYSLAGIPAP
ncbi:MAG: histidine phosphatase family protein [Gammaproteobacteria bacterium]|nr:histidine phosphatase family protein [Gammaproteobacteria bacterium]